MGRPLKQLRKVRDNDSDLEEFDDLMGKEDYSDDDVVNGDGDGDDDNEVGTEEEEEEEEEEEDEKEGEDEDEEEEEKEGDEYQVEEGDEDSEKGEEDEDDQHSDKRTDAEMEELEKEYRDLLNQEQDVFKNLKRLKDEDLVKGQAVKNQKVLWDKALEIRFLLQRSFANSNRLPQEPVRSSFCDSDGAVRIAYDDLITTSKKTVESLLELQQALIENNPSIFQSSSGNSGRVHKKNSKDLTDLDVEGDEDWLRISPIHDRIAPFRDKSVDKWQRMTQVTTGAAAIKGRLQAFNQSISDQVATYMRDPTKMVKQMQLRRSAVGVLGTVPEPMGNTKQEEAHPDGDPELLDDSEFYQQLLKEFFESVDPTSTNNALYDLKNVRTKKRKIVDRRASKSRKIRYNIHEKIVNFMAPMPMKLPPMAPKLFENLFGLKTQKPATVD